MIPLAAGKVCAVGDAVAALAALVGVGAPGVDVGGTGTAMTWSVSIEPVTVTKAVETHAGCEASG